MHNILITNKKRGKRKTIKYKIRFKDNVRFMVSSLSSLIDNLPEGLHIGKCKNCKSNLEYMTEKDDLVMFKCLDCNKTYKKYFDEDLLQRFQNICKLYDRDIKKLCFILRKSVYPNCKSAI